ncbi:uncharacterized protein MELLADRAFT_87842 [Melampsora larici-populina 98AG31]|uniref:TPR-like protein n=1 Tax=Melampsora larici-populina (strain 98AG31 / pathotype 3-4-7) TaxID=747676 RepID=F4RPN7_MELLP|nr:uncharacterized protein MELLADRAFT_87842 [Melampsora larici-populina 98AG31]EGG05699.1 hypothetical protein MELLADRAFT_87842 [Melampsora larici-populina 98AG31]
MKRGDVPSHRNEDFQGDLRTKELSSHLFIQALFPINLEVTFNSGSLLTNYNKELMATLKSHLKAARDAISKKDWTGAEAAAESALALDTQSYNAHVFLGLARLNLKKLEESRTAYQQAIDLDPSQPLAWQGLVRLHESSNDNSALIDALEGLAKIWNEKQDAEKLGDTILKLISLKDISRKQTISVLSHLLPNSLYEALLSTLPEPDNTNPKYSPIFDLLVLLQNNLPIIKQITDLTQVEENDAISREIFKRRTRLTSIPKTAAETRLEVIREVYPSSQLPKLWKEILNHPYADDEVRREVELALLTYYLDWLEALPSPFKGELADLSNAASADSSEVIQSKQEDKDRLRDAILEVARGQVVLKVANTKSWDIVLDWNEITSPRQEDDPHGYLISLGDIFPNSDITAVLEAYRQFHLEPETDEQPDDIDILEQMESGFDSAQKHSLLSHFLVLSVYYELRDWSTVKLIAENCISKTKELERLLGKRLTKATKKLECYLAIALTYLDAPRYHLQATRLIDKLLDKEPNHGPILMAQASILKSSQRWLEAILSFTQALKSWTDLPPLDRLEAKSDKAWCLVELERTEEAAEQFDNIIHELTELIEADPEQESIHQDLAQNWYRLARCKWAMYHTEDKEKAEEMDEMKKTTLKKEAYNCFIKSVKVDTAFAPSFTYLGLYYSEEGDYGRASKCFQKAFELDATESVAAFRLATEFAESREWDLVEVVAKRLINGGVETGSDYQAGEGHNPLQLASYQQHSWAWNAIGSVELSRGKFQLAAGTFQRAIRATPTDPHTWIKLGLAYRGVGKHVAALKTFIRASQLFEKENEQEENQSDDDQSPRWFADFCICDVQRQIGLIEPAITGLQKIIKHHPEEVVVKIILAETKYANAIQFSNKGNFSQSEEDLIQSLDLINQVFETGDSRYTMRIGWKIWRMCTGMGRSGNNIRPAQPIQFSILDTLGTLAFNLSRRLCQHAYIKSVELNPKNHISWTNLGFLYLAHSDVELANQAFLKSQIYEPDWALAWLGQALVAALNDHLDQSNELVEHAFTLSQSNITQIDLAYTTTAFARFAENESKVTNNLEDLHAPLLAVSKLVQRFPTDPTILNLQGILLEAIGKYEEASLSLEKAAEILEGIYEISESIEIETRFSIINLNLGRLKSRIKEYEGSRQAFEIVESLRGPFDKENDKLEDLEKIIMIRSQALSGISLSKYFSNDIEGGIEGFKKILSELSGIDSSQSETLTKTLRQHISALAQLLCRILWNDDNQARKIEAREILTGVATRNARLNYHDLNVVMTLASMSIVVQDDPFLDDLLLKIQQQDDPTMIKGPSENPDHEPEQSTDYTN